MCVLNPHIASEEVGILAVAIVQIEIRVSFCQGGHAGSLEAELAVQLSDCY